MPHGIYKRLEWHRQIYRENGRKMKCHSKAAKNKIIAALIGHPVSEETRKKIGNSNKGKIISDACKRKISKSLKGNIPWNKGKTNCYSEETKNKIRSSLIGKSLAPFTAEHKKKMRISSIHYIENTGGISPRIGSNERNLLDEQEKIDSCKMQRGYHIKELGYFVDGYCPETNTIYEVYEKFHDKQVQKDLERKNEICNTLSCDFVIIHDRTH